MKILVTEEFLNDDTQVFFNYVMQELSKALDVHLTEEIKAVDYDFIYGKGSYEELIFGGAPGL